MMIKGYHSYSDWNVLSLEDDDLFDNYTFGFELEVQRGESDVSCDNMSNILEAEFENLFIYEHDGSIGDGFEIISQPITWNWFKANISKFKKLFMILNNANYRSHKGNKCGLHVHIGKQGLGLLTKETLQYVNSGISSETIKRYQLERIGDVATNINIMLERFKNELFMFSRRKEFDCNWCRYLNAEITLENGFKVVDKDGVKANTKPEIMRGSGTHNDRYKALNLSNNKTVELRIFRGTLKWSTFYFTINLVNNLVNNAKQKNNVVEWKDLVFQGLNSREKRLCKDYCNERNIDLSRNLVISIGIEKNKLQIPNRRVLLNSIMNDGISHHS